jgi:hypothetical protein
MAKWTLDGYDRLMRDDKQVLELGWFDGEGTAALRERIVALLNAAEPGGLIDTACYDNTDDDGTRDALEVLLAVKAP